MTSDHERAFAFQMQVLHRTSTHERELPWGTAYFHEGFPLRYDANFAIADRPLGATTADEVVSTLDEVYDGFRHREVEFASSADADAIALGMAEHGYSVEGLLVMALRRDPDRAPDPGLVEEVELDEMRPFIEEVSRREPWGKEAGMPEMMASYREVLVDGIGARFFAQRVDGRIAGSCELYVGGDVAQIEDVNTLEEFRGRGIARNVVLRAAAEAREAGASLVFLFADADDWPSTLYARLGFDEIGRSRLFRRWPEEPASADASQKTDVKSPAAG
ncbi:MAG TPA: GNAT family N-acetyltransferase [Actinomycetota bacterium]